MYVIFMMLVLQGVSAAATAASDSASVAETGPAAEFLKHLSARQVIVQPACKVQRCKIFSVLPFLESAQPVQDRGLGAEGSPQQHAEYWSNTASEREYIQVL